MSKKAKRTHPKRPLSERILLQKRHSKLIFFSVAAFCSGVGASMLVFFLDLPKYYIPIDFAICFCCISLVAICITGILSTIVIDVEKIKGATLYYYPDEFDPHTTEFTPAKIVLEHKRYNYAFTIYGSDICTICEELTVLKHTKGKGKATPKTEREFYSGRSNFDAYCYLKYKKHHYRIGRRTARMIFGRIDEFTPISNSVTGLRFTRN